MDKLQLPQAKLLYLIAEIYKAGQINETEKTRLKGKHYSLKKTRNGHFK